MSLAKIIYLDDKDTILEKKIDRAFNAFSNASSREEMVEEYLEFKRLLDQRSERQILKMERLQNLRAKQWQ